MSKQDFDSQLGDSQKQEDILAATFKAMDYVRTSTSQEFGNFPGWDVTSSKCDLCKDFTVEVKFDKLAAKTGNVAVEIKRKDYNTGKSVPSGLSASTADIWAYVFPDKPDCFFTISATKLKELISNKIYHTKLWGGDGHRALLALIDRDKFISYCTPLKKYISDNTGVSQFTTQSNS